MHFDNAAIYWKFGARDFKRFVVRGFCGGAHFLLAIYSLCCNTEYNMKTSSQQKQVGEMNNEEFKAYIRKQVRSAYNQGQIAVIDEAIYAAQSRVESLQKRRELLIGDVMPIKCPKCGTVGEHYCPAEVARE